MEALNVNTADKESSPAADTAVHDNCRPISLTSTSDMDIQGSIPYVKDEHSLTDNNDTGEFVIKIEFTTALDNCDRLAGEERDSSNFDCPQGSKRCSARDEHHDRNTSSSNSNTLIESSNMRCDEKQQESVVVGCVDEIKQEPITIIVDFSKPLGPEVKDELPDSGNGFNTSMIEFEKQGTHDSHEERPGVKEYLHNDASGKDFENTHEADITMKCDLPPSCSEIIENVTPSSDMGG